MRRIAGLYNQSGQSDQAAIQKYAQKHNCSDETAAKFLVLAKQNHSRVPFYQAVQDEYSGDHPVGRVGYNGKQEICKKSDSMPFERRFIKVDNLCMWHHHLKSDVLEMLKTVPVFI